MDMFSYETVVRFSAVTSLSIFIALFLIMLAYVFLVAKRDRLEEAQMKALDLGAQSGQDKLGERA
jgi:cbb3-type cytochrome oxidase subunit 3